MGASTTELKPRFITGWKLDFLKLKVGLSFGKYVLQRKKFPLFSLSLWNMIKLQRDLGISKAVRFGNHYYYAILRNPRWPSPAFDEMVARRGFDAYAKGHPLKTPTDSVILAFSRECLYSCQHCYEKLSLGQKDSVPLKRWKEIVRELQDIGVNVVILSGGEPMLRYEELLELLESGNKNISEFHLHSSGYGLTLDKALRLKAAGLGAAGIGLEDPNPERYDKFRGCKGAFREAVEALKNLNRAGVFTYTNMFLKKEVIQEGDLKNYLELVKNLGGGIVLFLEAKPCGEYLFGNMDEALSETERKLATEFFLEANRRKEYRHHPLIHYYSYYEKPERFGCLMGGLSHFYVDSGGHVEPCIYMPVSFGNILDENLTEIYQRMRKAIPRPLIRGCPSVWLAEKIRLKRKKDSILPLPFSEIEAEWHELYEKDL